MSHRGVVDEQLAAAKSPSFSPFLASLYEQRHGRARRRHLATALLLTALAVLVAATLDFINNPGRFMAHAAARAGVIVLCLAGAALALRARSGARETAAYGLPLLGQSALSAWMGASAPPDLVDRNVVIFLILFAILCAVPPLPAASSRLLAACWFGCFVATFWLVTGSGDVLHHAAALGIGGVALAVGTVMAARRDNERRREFLRTLQAEQSAVELGRINAELEWLTNTDVLTGVANRRRFETEMRAAWDMRVGLPGPGGAIGLILVDVDHFKLFNDGAGHAEGDDCLRRIAGAISGVVRGGSLSVARWGGEEFVVLAPGVARKDVFGVAERVRRAVEALDIAHPALQGRCVTVSVGAAWCGADLPCGSPDELLREADHALYAAKSGGRNRVVVSSGLEAAGE